MTFCACTCLLLTQNGHHPRQGGRTVGSPAAVVNWCDAPIASVCIKRDPDLCGELIGLVY
jgi:hypothetical protein